MAKRNRTPDIEGNSTNKMLEEMAIDALQDEPQGKSSGYYNHVSILLDGAIKDRKKNDEISSLVLEYGTEVYIEGYRAGYRAATKLIVAGMQ